jgi:CheY-like chemotaxis protein
MEKQCHIQSICKKVKRHYSPWVLVIDDSNFMQLYMKNMLEGIGYHVVCAKDGLDGVNLFTEYEPQIVIIDANMPIMDGFTACSTIRQLEKGKNALLFMITTDTSTETIDKAFRVGFDDYYTKPILDSLFIAKMKRLFHLKKTKVHEPRSVDAKKEIEEARRLQNILLPRPFENNFVSVKNIYSPYDQVSGDMFDYWFDEKEKTLTGYIVDATGHNLVSAIQVSAARMLFCQAAKSGLKLNGTLGYINHELCKSNLQKKVIFTMTAAILFMLDFRNNTLQYAAAGISPFFIHKKSGEIVPIKTKGCPLGIKPKPAYKVVCLPMADVSRIVFASDGFSEMITSNEEVNGKHDDASAIVIDIK